MSWRRLGYSVLLYGLVPVFLLRLWWRGRANPAYRLRWRERFALQRFDTMQQARQAQTTGQPVQSDQPERAVICLHAVSVGETMAARPLIEQLLLVYPQHTLWITSTTPTGSDTVQRLFGGRVQHCYLPYDLPDAVERFMRQLQPALLLVMETELWPNLYAACSRHAVPQLLVNARLSERSARGYGRIARLVGETLAHVRVIAARDAQDAARFLALGATDAQVQIAGNIKFDLTLEAGLDERGKAMHASWGDRPVWVAGSTHAGEDELLLQAHRQVREQYPDLLLILVPRHPERFDAVAGLCVQQGLSLSRRSRSERVSMDTGVLLGDSMGELLLWYAAADIAFIGGSLVEVGGHNPLEAAAFGLPILSGPHIHNFADLYPALVMTGGAVLVDSTDDLAHYLLRWLADDTARQQAGQAGRLFLQQHQGVVMRLMQIVRMLMTE